MNVKKEEMRNLVPFNNKAIIEYYIVTPIQYVDSFGDADVTFTHPLPSCLVQWASSLDYDPTQVTS